MGEQPRKHGRPSADEQAWLGRLAEEMLPRLWAYTRRVCGDTPEAEDIVAETFCRATSNLKALRGSPRPDLYLLTTARNLCRDAIRRTRVAPAKVSGCEAELAAVARSDEPVIDVEEHAALRAAVTELPVDLREVVVLRLSTGLTFAEVARVLEIPLGTALSRMHAALEQLRKSMSPIHE
jgi:RNA polymerase sigma-70 factor, ECF subfamily